MAKFILSKKALLKQYKKAGDIADLISYSLKTNIEVGRLLEKETKCFFSVHAMEELAFVSDKKRVWFISHAWSEEELKKLFSLGVNKFIVDSQDDLKLLLSFIERENKEVELMLRMKLRENTIFTGKYFVFGMRSSEVNELIPFLSKNKRIKRLGVHFHRKTQNVSEWDLKHELSQSLSPETLSSIQVLNIGGGLPAEYKNVGIDSLPEIFEKFFELRKWLSERKIALMIEPGRFLAAAPVVLEAEIKGIQGDGIIVDCSVYNASMDSIIIPLKLLVEGELDDEHGIKGKGSTGAQTYTIKGCTPCSLDIFRYQVRLPEKRVGDKIRFLNAGAYNFATEFCCLQTLETEIID